MLMFAGNYTSSEFAASIPYFGWLIAVLCVFAPALVLGSKMGSRGFSAGLLLGSVVSYVIGILPFWFFVFGVMQFTVYAFVSISMYGIGCHGFEYDSSEISSDVVSAVMPVGCAYCGKTASEIKAFTYSEPYYFDSDGKKRCGWCGAKLC